MRKEKLFNYNNIRYRPPGRGALQKCNSPESCAEGFGGNMTGLIVDTLLDVVDATDGVTSLREAIDHVNAGTLSGTITFANRAAEAF